MKEEEYKELANRAYKIVERPDSKQDILREVYSVFGQIEDILQRTASEVYHLDGIVLPYKEYWESNTSMAIYQIENGYKRKNEDTAYDVRSQIQYTEQKKEEEEKEGEQGSEEEKRQRRIQDAEKENETIVERIVSFSKNGKYAESVKGAVQYAISDSRSKLMRSLSYTSLPSRKIEDIEYEISYVINDSKLKLDTIEELLEQESDAKAKEVISLYDYYRMIAEQREERNSQEVRSERNDFVASLSEGVVVDEEKARREAERKAQENARDSLQALPSNIIE